MRTVKGGDCTDWKQEALSLWREGKSWGDITRIVRDKYFPNELLETVRDSKVRYYIRNLDEYKNRGKKPVDIMTTAQELLTKGTTRTELSKQLGISLKLTDALVEEIKQQGFNVWQWGDEIKISTLVIPTTNIVKRAWNGDKIIRFGLMGDTQINSKYTQITHLHALYDIYASEGLTDVYMTGDIDEGEDMRTGHKYECYTQGADDHVSEIVNVYPKRDGITTHFITGNHDHSLIKRAGLDIGRPIAEKRADLKYLGQSSAVIYLTDNCTLELRHPIDGTAYAISYKTQKMIEAMSGGEKPNILGIGHYHKSEYIFYRNVHALQTGCLQAQTPWMRGKQIAAAMGGWILEVHVNDDGTIERIKQEFIPFYKAIKDDYLNWR